MSTSVNIEFLPVEFTNVEIHVEPTTEETVAVVHEQQLTIIEVHVDINAAQAAIDAAAAAQLILQQIIALEGDPGPQITTPGTSTLNELARTYTFEDWAWKWYGPTIFTPSPFTTPEIPEEDEGFIRVYLLVGTATGAYQLVIGDPSDTLPIDPPTPANTIYLTRFVSSGAVIGEPEAPIVGDAFVKKNYSNRHSIFTGIVDGVYPLPDDGRTSFVFEVGGLDFEGFSIPDGHPHLYEGKIVYIKNTSGQPINLKHDGIADVWFNQAGGVDLVVPSDEQKTLMFKFSFEEGLTWINQGGDVDFDPADYDLNQFQNLGLDPFIKQSEVNIHYRGKFTSLANLEVAIPVGNDGDYAIIDAGTGTDAIQYIWDTEEGWVSGGSVGPADTDALPEGVSNLYFTVARVLATVLTGISFATGGAVVSTDTVLQAFGKLQKQINDLISGKLDNPTGTPNGTKFLRDDNAWTDLPVATESQSGVVSTTSQEFNGNKTIRLSADGGTAVGFGVKTTSTGTFVFQVRQNGQVLFGNLLMVGSQISTSSGGSSLTIGGNTSTIINQGNSNLGTVLIGSGTNSVFTNLNTTRNFVRMNQGWISGVGVNQVIRSLLFDGTFDFTGYGGGQYPTCIHINPTLINCPKFYAIHAEKGTVHIGVSTPNDFLIFEVASSEKQSLPFPKMTETQRLAISSPVVGGHVYQTDGTEGVYVYKSGGWTFAY